MFVHGNNLEQKENHQTKYRDAKSRQYLTEIRLQYDQWKQANIDLKGPFLLKADSDLLVLEKRTKLLNGYKNFIDQQKYAEQFDSRSNLHSSVLEEFMYYLFKDMVADFSEHALIGKSHTFKDLFFKSHSYKSMLTTPNVLIEKKDHDFAIGVRINADFKCFEQSTTQSETWDIPAVTVECKTYLDKTMLQDASTAAELLKHRNPNVLYIVVAEWLKLTEAVNLRKFKIDQIYVLRKQKNTDREFRYLDSYTKRPIYEDTVEHLFHFVRDFLTEDWEGGINHRLAKGYLL
ncbi:MAG: Bpu10I family restriction endonuclease [Nitrospirae bacterium]|uniref:Bpu10I family restriction endonuclease n=1 Tax=Candidatus Magnetobacterium casense TaxID=1455061 RepID=UPI00058D2CAA|nr:Bpu10I family restriction endonuclease [Candidatus Magnetobacterium casensis]MBF0338108.1 Bpu10I family restriction endonuclease [Nitrospirota bacterium]